MRKPMIRSVICQIQYLVVRVPSAASRNVARAFCLFALLAGCTSVPERNAVPDGRERDAVIAGIPEARIVGVMRGKQVADEPRQVLEALYTGTDTSGIIERRSTLAATPGDAITDSAPLRRQVAAAIDGGIAAQAFIYPPRVELGRLSKAEGIARERSLYVIRSSTLRETPTAVKPRLGAIAGRSMSMLIKQQGLGDPVRIFPPPDGMSWTSTSRLSRVTSRTLPRSHSTRFT
jgi:hypothetical protein